MTKTKRTIILNYRPWERFADIKHSEILIVFWAFLYFFLLLASYFILRPLRDEMGIANGAANMQWLFSGTFITMLIMVPVFGYVTARFKIGTVLTSSYMFFIANILLFYYLFTRNTLVDILPIIFFIWLSVFNLFAISLFWSFMVDLFSSDQSKRLFGIISAGGSLGAISGPLVSTTLSASLGIANMFLVAASLLSLSLVSLLMLVKMQRKIRALSQSESGSFKNSVLNKKDLLNGIKLVMASKYLKGLCLFMILYTTISTFLYFEQANIIEDTFLNSSERVAYFSTVDLITNTLAILGQFFITSKFIKGFGLSTALGLIPLLIALGFIILSTNTVLVIVAVLLIVHRVGNYALMRPGREVLYTLCDREEKYRAKNFIDTAVYRGGDAISGWAFAGLVSLGLGLSVIAIIAIPIAILWGYMGYQLGKKHSRRQKLVQLNLDIIQ
jgi:AAA family ATP:ADP antiporter